MRGESNLYEPFRQTPLEENVDPSGLCDSAVSESPNTYIDTSNWTSNGVLNPSSNYALPSYTTPVPFPALGLAANRRMAGYLRIGVVFRPGGGRRLDKQRPVCFLGGPDQFGDLWRAGGVGGGSLGSLLAGSTASSILAANTMVRSLVRAKLLLPKPPGSYQIELPPRCPRQVIFVTPEAPLATATQAELRSELVPKYPTGPTATPTHVVTGSPEGVQFDYASFNVSRGLAWK